MTDSHQENFIITSAAIKLAADFNIHITEATMRNWGKRYPGLSRKIGGRWLIDKSRLETLLEKGFQNETKENR